MLSNPVFPAQPFQFQTKEIQFLAAPTEQISGSTIAPGINAVDRIN